MIYDLQIHTIHVGSGQRLSYWAENLGIIPRFSPRVAQDTYYLYDDDTRNLTAILRKKENSIDETSPQWLITGFAYDEKTNNLKTITDPAGNETELVYDTEYQTYIIRDIREIKQDNK